MEYRQLGSSGLKVSELSFGSWITFGSSLDLIAIKKCIRAAYERGINFFDNAEVYGSGASELLMGEALRDYRREDLVISTKIFWGGEGVNDQGLSKKHLWEGVKNSIRRLQLDYVDLLFCHRPDPETPIEETVRTMDLIVRSGLALYWGTSEWKASEIEEAHKIAKELHATPPVVEQPEYNLFRRERVEKEYGPLYEKYGIGTTIWSPLDSGILTGKYNEGIPAGSRLFYHEELRKRLSDAKIEKVKALIGIAKELNCSIAQLAIAWCLKNPRVSSVITGATHLQQLDENLHAIEVKSRLTDDFMQKIEQVLNKK